jgi:hypothetical protein
MRNYLLIKLNAVILVSFSCSCSSGRLPFILPPTAAHTLTAAPDSALFSPAKETENNQVTETSIVTAELPTDKSVLGVRYATSISDASIQLLVAPPDTSKPVKQTFTEPSADVIRQADSTTRVVNTIGVVILVLGIVLIIAAFISTSPGWLPFALLLYGAIAAAVSIPFLFFRSKNSSSKLREDKQREARRAAKGK